MDPKETFGKIYRVDASHSRKALDFAQVKGRESDFRPKPSGELVARGIRHLIQYRYHSGANQQFLLFPQDDGAYVIATLDSGSVIDIAKVSSAEGTPAIDFPFNGGANQSFVLEPNGDGTHMIRAKHSGLVLDVFRESRDDRTLVLQHHFKNGGNQKFTFVTVDSYTFMTKGAIGDPGVPPPASSITANLPASTDPALIGEVFLPYFLVGDTLSRVAAIKQTPYYRLTRHQFWAKTGQFNFSGPAQTREFQVKQGLTKQESVAMEKTISMSLSGTYNIFKLDKLAASFTQAISAGLKVTTTETTTESTETTFTRRVEYKGGPEILFAEYVLVDRYTLSRTDGTVINRPWESKNADIFRQIVFPPQAAAKIVSRTM